MLHVSAHEPAQPEDDVDVVERADYASALYVAANESAKVPAFYSNGIVGSNSKIAIVEERIRTGSAATWFNPFLAPSQPGGDHSTVDPSCPLPTSAADYAVSVPFGHVVGVASVASANYIFQFSGAPGARVLSANSCLPSLSVDESDFVLTRRQHAAEQVMNWMHPQVYNHSYGEAGPVGFPIPYQTALDFRARYYRTVEVKACGNDALQDPSGHKVGCAEFNSVQVGGLDDQGTGTWNDDSVAQFASWRNPRVIGAQGMIEAGDRELPSVVASAQNVPIVDATDSEGTIFATGTSFAAPRVAALAAMFQERLPWTKAWPEVVRAAILATSVHRRLARGFFGDATDLPFPDWLPKRIGGGKVNDLRVGLGGVSGKALNRLIDGSGHVEGILTRPVDFDASGRYVVRKWTVHKPANSARVQFVMAYNSFIGCTHCSQNDVLMSNNGLGNDYDLYVVDSVTGQDIRVDPRTGELADPNSTSTIPLASASFDSSFEVLEIDFKKIPLASVEVELRRYQPPMNMTPPSEMIGIAWYESLSWEDEAL